MVVVGLVLASLGLTTGCDETRFCDPSAVVNSSYATKRVRSIDAGLGPQDYTSELAPNATFPRQGDWEYVAEDYLIGPNDVVDITVLDLFEANIESTLRRQVSISGYIDLPLLQQRIKAEGLTKDQLKAAIIAAYSVDVIRNPTVSVTVVSERNNTFSILGAVQRPGTYNVTRRDMRLLEALALAGGISQTNIRYIYVIRPTPAQRVGGTPATAPAPSGPTGPAPLPVPTATVPEATQPSTGPANPDDAIKRLFKPGGETTTPAPSALPRLTEMAGGDATSASEPTSLTAAEPATGAGPAASTQGGGEPSDLTKLTRNPQWVWSPSLGRYVPVEGEPTSMPTGPTTTVGPRKAETTTTTTEPGGEDVFGWGKVSHSDMSRVIAINLRRLQEGDPQMNIIIRDNDIIQVPMLEMGEFYVMGEVLRPGVYSLTGRRVTVKMAIAAAGNLGPIAWPKNTILIRRVGESQEQMFPIDVEAIFRGLDDDVFLKPDDVIAVGQSVLGPFTIVLRNAFRFTWGFGFIYDRNFADALIPGYSYDSTRFTHW